MANLNHFCKFFELSMDKRRHPSAISPFAIFLVLQRHQHLGRVFCHRSVAGSGICSLTSGVSRQFHRHFLLLLDSLELWYHLQFFQYGLFTSDFSSFLHGVVRQIHMESTPYYASRPSTFGNIEPWMILEGTTGLNEPSDLIWMQKPLQICICLKRLPWQRINKFEHVTKDWTF